MEWMDIERRLAVQERLLHAILGAIAPPEQEGSGLDDLISTLADLTVAVADVTDAVRALRWQGSAPFPLPAAPR